MATAENIWAWSTTAADNNDADSAINWVELQDPGTVNNSARAMMAATKRWANVNSGNVTVGGTGDAITITTGQSISAAHQALGLRICFKAAATNTGAVTVAVDGLATKALKAPSGDELAAYNIIADGFYDIVFDGTDYQLLSGLTNIENTPTGSWWFDDTPPARFIRMTDRLLLGAGLDYAGTTDKTDGATYIGDPAQDFNSFYLERSSALTSLSPNGGVGGLFGTRRSDKYGDIGSPVTTWETGQAVTLGDERAYSGDIYVAANSGTTGATPPTHSVGSASDGAVTWAYDRTGNGVPIALSFATLNDAPGDAQGTWGMYGEVVRSSGAGSTYLAEFNVKNKGNDVLNQPYFIQPAGFTIGLWLAAGGDSSVGAPANPSTAAIVIGNNAETWNTGIVFDADGIEGTDGSTGSGYAIKMARGHTLAWFTPETATLPGSLGAQINSSVDLTASRVGLLFDDDMIVFQHGVGTTMGRFEHGGGASAAANYLRLFSTAAGTSPRLLAGGSDSNLDLILSAKGTGNVSFGTHDGSLDAAITGYITIKDSGGTTRKLAVIS